VDANPGGAAPRKFNFRHCRRALEETRIGTHGTSEDLIDNWSLKIGHWQMWKRGLCAERLGVRNDSSALQWHEGKRRCRAALQSGLLAACLSREIFNDQFSIASANALRDRHASSV
jgi:hypothetical protein